MNKQEFIDKLRAALSGRVAPGVVTENVNYYDEYIDMEMQRGRGEAEVLQMLGDPRLIAKTIIETNGKGDMDGFQESFRESFQDSTYQSYGYRDEEQSSSGNQLKTFHLPGWLCTIIVIAVVILIFGAVLSVLSFLAPVLITIIVVMFLVKLFRDWLN